MNTKLTLHLDEKLIAKAERFSTQSGKSVSQLVADYFAFIGADYKEVVKITPRVRALKGSLKTTKVTETQYRRHLEQKSK